MDKIEWLGVITGIAAVYLLYKNNILTWPVGFINIGCFMLMFWQQKLYGDFVVQIIFLSTGIWGWIHWNKRMAKLPGTLSYKQTLTCVMATLALIPLTMHYLKNYTDCSYPLAEAAILNISIAGQILTGLRKIENWYWWLVADLLMIFVYYQKELYPTAIYAGIIFIIGIFGLFSWRKLISDKKNINL